MITSFYYVIIYLLCKDYFIEKVFRGHITIRLKMIYNLSGKYIYSFEKTTNMLIYILTILILISIPSSL